MLKKDCDLSRRDERETLYKGVKQTGQKYDGKA